MLEHDLRLFLKLYCSKNQTKAFVIFLIFVSLDLGLICICPSSNANCCWLSADGWHAKVLQCQQRYCIIFFPLQPMIHLPPNQMLQYLMGYYSKRMFLIAQCAVYQILARACVWCGLFLYSSHPASAWLDVDNVGDLLIDQLAGLL